MDIVIFGFSPGSVIVHYEITIDESVTGSPSQPEVIALIRQQVQPNGALAGSVILDPSDQLGNLFCFGL